MYKEVNNKLARIGDAYVSSYSDNEWLVVSCEPSVKFKVIEALMQDFVLYDAGANDDRVMLTFKKAEK